MPRKHENTTETKTFPRTASIRLGYTTLASVKIIHVYATSIAEVRQAYWLQFDITRNTTGDI